MSLTLWHGVERKKQTGLVMDTCINITKYVSRTLYLQIELMLAGNKML